MNPLEEFWLKPSIDVWRRDTRGNPSFNLLTSDPFGCAPFPEIHCFAPCVGSAIMQSRCGKNANYISVLLWFVFLL